MDGKSPAGIADIPFCASMKKAVPVNPGRLSPDQIQLDDYLRRMLSASVT